VGLFTTQQLPAGAPSVVVKVSPGQGRKEKREKNGPSHFPLPPPPAELRARSGRDRRPAPEHGPTVVGALPRWSQKKRQKSREGAQVLEGERNGTTWWQVFGPERMGACRPMRCSSPPPVGHSGSPVPWITCGSGPSWAMPTANDGARCRADVRPAAIRPNRPRS